MQIPKLLCQNLMERLVLKVFKGDKHKLLFIHGRLGCLKEIFGYSIDSK